MVCTSWHKICKDPVMWRVIDIHNVEELSNVGYGHLKELCKHAVYRSQGRLVEIKIEYLGTKELMEYIAERQRYCLVVIGPLLLFQETVGSTMCTVHQVPVVVMHD
ncbi:hypothetical protein POM88_029517 [Heracleum sosnowskyi]|uniref:F-box domain-containing protein n=1 Tax=Heracleum sosnowskyi TaxID=360622 RepID=A0AAD8MHR5_9APIA|nr:hypothetical protein POM88_029517 [Heracleum sosnowskyi]